MLGRGSGAGPAFGAALLLFSPLPLAGTYSLATVSVSTSVAANCKIQATPTVAFGAYDPIGTNQTNPVDVSSFQITIACVGGTSPRIDIDLGAHASGSTRRLLKTTLPADYLNYELYKPNTSNVCFSGALAVWGTGATNGLSPASQSTAANQNFRICARLFGGQDPTVGTYTDTVNAIVNF
jgi:spore coat protein U-like protein